MARILCNLPTGTSSYYLAASPVSFAGDFDITVKFWARAVGNLIILGNNASGNNFLAVIAGGVLRLNIAGTDINSASGVVESALYYTCRATRVGTAVTLYLDGVSVATGTKAGTLTLDSIGAYNAGSLLFNGYIADVDLGTYAWDLDEPTAATEDSTPTGNILTYTNIATSQRSIFTESATYWWGENGDILDLDVTQPANDAYMLAGQSNMVGSAPIVGGTDDVYSTLGGRVHQFGFTTQVLSGAFNPLDHADEVSGDMGLWREMCLGLSASNLLMLPCADGGTGFTANQWNPGDVEYNAAVASVNAGMLSNSQNTLKAMIWLLGESDAIANQTEASHLADIQAMRTGMITDITDMTADTPWIVIEIGTLLGTYAQINSALASFVASIPNGVLIPKTGLTLFDAVHYDAASIRSIGTQAGVIAEAFATPSSDGNPHFPKLSGELNIALSGGMSGGLT